jgi:glycyl-tRNA synthetase beta chain
MLDHQKYFPIQDQEGKLLNSFVFIANQPVTEKIIKGNERVIRARFKDAEFFFNEDQKIRLDKLHAKLDGLMFTKESGTMLDKSKRVAQILNILIPFFALSEDEIEQSFRAAFLAKTDLLTHLVFEFPELQGKIGSILALAQGENEGTARAILEQYLPLGSGSELPATRVGAIISIAEKFDNLITLFLNGKIPTGSADPYALRRQTSAILEILVKFEVRLDLSKITRQIIGDIEQNILHKPSADGKSKALIELLDFIKKRAWTILEGKKFTFDEIDAFQNGAHLDIYLGIKKLESIQEIKKGYNFKPLILTFKRIHNILTAARKKAEKIPAEIKPSLLQDKEEQELFQVRDALEGEIRKYLQEESFAKAIDTMIQLRPPIDQFFEKVMVMAEDSQLRQNRLALLEKIETLFLDFLDLSRIQE